MSHPVFHSCKYRLKTYSWKHFVGKVVGFFPTWYLEGLKIKIKYCHLHRNTEPTSVLCKWLETLPPLWTQKWHCLFWDSYLRNKEFLCQEPKQEKKGKKKIQEKVDKVHTFSDSWELRRYQEKKVWAKSEVIKKFSFLHYIHRTS